MTAPDLRNILKLFRNPVSTNVAAQRFGWPQSAVDGLVKQLEARGMLTEAEPGIGACSSGCGMCSLQNFCPKPKESNSEEPSQELTKAKVWRLTPLGEQSVSS